MILINPYKSGIQNLLEAVNTTFNKDYTLDDIDFDTPIDDNTKVGYNTKVLIIGKTILGSKYYWYNRIKLEEINGNYNVNIAGAFSLKELRRRVSKATNLALSDIDLGIDAIPEISQNQSLLISTSATPNSYIYTGTMLIALGMEDTIGINDDPYLDGWEIDHNYSYGTVVNERKVTGALLGDGGYIEPTPSVIIHKNLHILR